MSHVRIHSISDLNFGKHKEISFPDLDHNFVVFYGLNETGKSTLAEFLTWTLGGPWRPAKDGSDRFRSPNNEHVSGRLVGAIDGEALDINAKFKIKDTGHPNDLRSGMRGKQTFDAKNIGVLFNGLTADDYRWIYRLYGVELGKIGTAEDFSNLFSNFTMGNAATSGNPRERAKDLSSRAAKVSKEIKDLEKKSRQLSSDIKTAKKAPDDLGVLKTEEGNIEVSLETQAQTLITLQKDKELVTKARGGLDATEGQRRAQSELALLGSVPADWDKIVAISDDVRKTRSAIEDHIINESNAKKKLEEAATRVGLTTDILLGQGLSSTERLDLQTAASKVSAAQVKKDDAGKNIVEIDKSVRALIPNIKSIASATGVRDENFASVVELAHTFTDLQGPAALWLQASQDKAGSESTLAGAQALAESISLQKDPTVSETKKALSPVLLMGILVGVGLLSLINPLLSLAGAIVGGISIFALSKKRTTGMPTDSDQASRLREAQNQVALIQSKIATETSKCDSAAQRVLEPISIIGCTGINADTAKSMLSELGKLAKAVSERETKFEELTLARQSLTSAEEALEQSTEIFNNLLAGRNVLNIPAMENFSSWLIDYEDAVNASHKHSLLVDALSTLTKSMQTHLLPVADEIAELPWSAIETRLADCEQLTVKIKIARDKLRESNIAVSAAGMDLLEIQAMLETYSSLEALNDREKDLSLEIGEINRQRDALIARRQEITSQVQERQEKEILPSLLLSLGETEESLGELSRHHQALMIASTMLEEMINRFERENQDPLIKEAQRLISCIAPSWGSLMYSRDAASKVIIERDGTGGKLIDNRLSDGGRALLYLGVRLAFAAKDAEKRGIYMPLICDDPLIHFDDERTTAAIALIKTVSEHHQVILFTCEESTRELARAQGAHIIEMS